MRQLIGVLVLVAVAMSAPAPQSPTFFFSNPFTSPGVLSLSPPALPQPQPQPQAAVAPAAPAAPAPVQNPVFTTTHFQAADGLGQFRFGFANTDGQVKTEIRNADTVVGMYRYISPEGFPIEMSYVADKNGFQATPVQAQAQPQQAFQPFQQFQALQAQPTVQGPTATAAGPVLPPELAQAHAEANLRLAQAYRDAEIRLAAAKQKAATEALANAIASSAAGGAGGAAEGAEAAAAGGADATGQAAAAQQQQQQSLVPVSFPIQFFPQFG